MKRKALEVETEDEPDKKRRNINTLYQQLMEEEELEKTVEIPGYNINYDRWTERQITQQEVEKLRSLGHDYIFDPNVTVGVWRSAEREGAKHPGREYLGVRDDDAKKVFKTWLNQIWQYVPKKEIKKEDQNTNKKMEALEAKVEKQEKKIERIMEVLNQIIQTQ